MTAIARRERPADAVKFVTRYLQSADRDTDHYQDALELIEKAEAEVGPKGGCGTGSRGPQLT